MTALRTAIIGFGTSGRVFHAPLVAADPAFSLDAIVTGSPERATEVAQRHPGTQVLTSVDDVFARAEEFDLVVIGTPNVTHAPLAQRAVAAGLHVVIDKPAAVHTADALAVVDAAEAAGRVVTVFQNRRWDGDFLTVRAVIEEGRLGEVLQFESAFESFKPRSRSAWKQAATLAEGGGLTYDLGAHLVDQAMQLFGPAQDLHAELDARRPGVAADDDAFLSVTHAGGVRSRLWMSTLAIEPRPRFRVVGTEGVLTIHGLDPQEAQLAAGIAPSDPAYGVRDAPARLTTLDGTTELPIARGAYPEFYRRLAAAIRDGAPAPVDARSSIAALALIERAGAQGWGTTTAPGGVSA